MTAIILTICKIAGTVAAVFMGILGILFETHDEVITQGELKRKKLNRVGHVFLTLTIVSGVIALAAQVFEETKNRAAELNQKSRDQAVLDNLIVSVDGIRRVVEQIHTIDSRVTVPLDVTNDLFLSLRSYLARRALPFTNYWDLNHNERAEKRRQNPGIDFIRIGSYDEAYNALAFDLITNSSPTALVSEKEFRLAYDLLQALASEKHQLRFYSQKPDDDSVDRNKVNRLIHPLIDSSGRYVEIKASYEIFCATTPRILNANISYEPSRERLEFSFNARFSSDFWTRLQPTISRPDLSQATFLLVLPEPKNGLFLSRKLTDANILIDGVRFLLPDLKMLEYSAWSPGGVSNLKNFKSVMERDAPIRIPASAKVYTATLPDLE